MDSKPLQTKSWSEKTGRRRGVLQKSSLKNPQLVLFRLKEFYYGYKLTCYSDGNLLALLSVGPANKHDVCVVKERFWEVVDEFTGFSPFLDKGYVSGELQEEFLKFGVVYTPVKRENQIRSLEEKKFYKYLSDFRSRIETLFSRFSAFLLKPNWSVSLGGWLLGFWGNSGC